MGLKPSKCCKCCSSDHSNGIKNYKAGNNLLKNGPPLEPIHCKRLHITGNTVQTTLDMMNTEETESNEKRNTFSGTASNIELKLDDSIKDELPNFLRRLNDLTVKVGTRTRFLVEIECSSNLTVEWFHNEQKINECERLRLIREGKFFCVDLTPVTVQDAGRWDCVARNSYGQTSSSNHLNVLVPKTYKPPHFQEELRALVTEQGAVSLECKVVGVPTPLLKWYKDGKEIRPGDIFALTANPDDFTSLGIYTCEAINCMGKAVSNSKLNITDRIIPKDQPIIFIENLTDVEINIGNSLTLSCRVMVPPWPKSITWYNSEGKVVNVLNNERYREMADGLGGYSISVYPTEACDQGDWKCVATSNEGANSISRCDVKMTIPKYYQKPRFMDSLQAILTEEGLVSFECKVIGCPTPVLSWFKDGQELKPGDVYLLTGSNSLGSYCCIAKNCMGEARSSAELTIEDIQNHLNDEERTELISGSGAPKILHGLKSVEVKINEPHRFTVQVDKEKSLNKISWKRDDYSIETDIERYEQSEEDLGVCHLDIKKVEYIDEAEWKFIAINEFGHSITKCFLKVIIPKYFKKPKFLGGLRAILTDEGTVNLECKVVGVPQPILTWYKDGVELKPGDIHKITSGGGGPCCLGIYTCEARNCLGTVSSSASLLGLETPKTDQRLDLVGITSLSTIKEERSSEMYDTAQDEFSIALDNEDRGEISFSFDGKDVSVSLYETPDLTEEEAIQIVEMYADELCERITENNVLELPSLRFVKETSTSGNILMEAVVVDVSEDYFTASTDDLRTEADVEDLVSTSDETADLMSCKSDTPRRPPRKSELLKNSPLLVDSINSEEVEDRLASSDGRRPLTPLTAHEIGSDLRVNRSERKISLCSDDSYFGKSLDLSEDSLPRDIQGEEGDGLIDKPSRMSKHLKLNKKKIKIIRNLKQNLFDIENELKSIEKLIINSQEQSEVPEMKIQFLYSMLQPIQDMHIALVSVEDDKRFSLEVVAPPIHELKKGLVTVENYVAKSKESYGFVDEICFEVLESILPQILNGLSTIESLITFEKELDLTKSPKINQEISNLLEEVKFIVDRTQNELLIKKVSFENETSLNDSTETKNLLQDLLKKTIKTKKCIKNCDNIERKKDIILKYISESVKILKNKLEKSKIPVMEHLVDMYESLVDIQEDHLVFTSFLDNFTDTILQSLSNIEEVKLVSSREEPSDEMGGESEEVYSNTSKILQDFSYNIERALGNSESERKTENLLILAALHEEIAFAVSSAILINDSTAVKILEKLKLPLQTLSNEVESCATEMNFVNALEYLGESILHDVENENLSNIFFHLKEKIKEVGEQLIERKTLIENPENIVIILDNNKIREEIIQDIQVLTKILNENSPSEDIIPSLEALEEIIHDDNLVKATVDIEMKDRLVIQNYIQPLEYIEGTIAEYIHMKMNTQRVEEFNSEIPLLEQLLINISTLNEQLINETSILQIPEEIFYNLNENLSTILTLPDVSENITSITARVQELENCLINICEEKFVDSYTEQYINEILQNIQEFKQKEDIAELKILLEPLKLLIKGTVLAQKMRGNRIRSFDFVLEPLEGLREIIKGVSYQTMTISNLEQLLCEAMEIILIEREKIEITANEEQILWRIGEYMNQIRKEILKITNDVNPSFKNLQNEINDLKEFLFTVHNLDNLKFVSECISSISDALLEILQVLIVSQDKKKNISSIIIKNITNSIKNLIEKLPSSSPLLESLNMLQDFIDSSDLNQDITLLENVNMLLNILNEYFDPQSDRKNLNLIQELIETLYCDERISEIIETIKISLKIHETQDSVEFKKKDELQEIPATHDVEIVEEIEENLSEITQTKELDLNIANEKTEICSLKNVIEESLELKTDIHENVEKNEIIDKTDTEKETKVTYDVEIGMKIEEDLSEKSQTKELDFNIVNENLEICSLKDVIEESLELTTQTLENIEKKEIMGMTEIEKGIKPTFDVEIVKEMEEDARDITQTKELDPNSTDEKTVSSLKKGIEEPLDLITDPHENVEKMEIIDVTDIEKEIKAAYDVEIVTEIEIEDLPELTQTKGLDFNIADEKIEISSLKEGTKESVELKTDTHENVEKMKIPDLTDIEKENKVVEIVTAIVEDLPKITQIKELDFNIADEKIEISSLKEGIERPLELKTVTHENVEKKEIIDMKDIEKEIKATHEVEIVTAIEEDLPKITQIKELDFNIADEKIEISSLKNTIKESLEPLTDTHENVEKKEIIDMTDIKKEIKATHDVEILTATEEELHKITEIKEQDFNIADEKIEISSLKEGIEKQLELKTVTHENVEKLEIIDMTDIEKEIKPSYNVEIVTKIEEDLPKTTQTKQVDLNIADEKISLKNVEQITNTHENIEKKEIIGVTDIEKKKETSSLEDKSSVICINENVEQIYDAKEVELKTTDNFSSNDMINESPSGNTDVEAKAAQEEFLVSSQPSHFPSFILQIKNNLLELTPKDSIEKTENKIICDSNNFLNYLNNFSESSETLSTESISFKGIISELVFDSDNIESITNILFDDKSSENIKFPKYKKIKLRIPLCYDTETLEDLLHEIRNYKKVEISKLSTKMEKLLKCLVPLHSSTPKNSSDKELNLKFIIQVKKREVDEIYEDSLTVTSSQLFKFLKEYPDDIEFNVKSQTDHAKKVIDITQPMQSLCDKVEQENLPKTLSHEESEEYFEALEELEDTQLKMSIILGNIRNELLSLKRRASKFSTDTIIPSLLGLDDSIKEMQEFIENYGHTLKSSNIFEFKEQLSSLKISLVNLNFVINNEELFKEGKYLLAINLQSLDLLLKKMKRDESKLITNFHKQILIIIETLEIERFDRKIINSMLKNFSNFNDNINELKKTPFVDYPKNLINLHEINEISKHANILDDDIPEEIFTEFKNFNDSLKCYNFHLKNISLNINTVIVQHLLDHHNEVTNNFKNALKQILEIRNENDTLNIIQKKMKEVLKDLNELDEFIKIKLEEDEDTPNFHSFEDENDVSVDSNLDENVKEFSEDILPVEEKTQVHDNKINIEQKIEDAPKEKTETQVEIEIENDECHGNIELHEKEAETLMDIKESGLIPEEKAEITIMTDTKEENSSKIEEPDNTSGKELIIERDVLSDNAKQEVLKSETQKVEVIDDQHDKSKETKEMKDQKEDHIHDESDGGDGNMVKQGKEGKLEKINARVKENDEPIESILVENIAIEKENVSMSEIPKTLPERAELKTEKAIISVDEEQTACEIQALVSETPQKEYIEKKEKKLQIENDDVQETTERKDHKDKLGEKIVETNLQPEGEKENILKENIATEENVSLIEITETINQKEIGIEKAVMCDNEEPTIFKHETQEKLEKQQEECIEEKDKEFLIEILEDTKKEEEKEKLEKVQKTNSQTDECDKEPKGVKEIVLVENIAAQKVNPSLIEVAENLFEKELESDKAIMVNNEELSISNNQTQEVLIGNFNESEVSVSKEIELKEQTDEIYIKAVKTPLGTEDNSNTNNVIEGFKEESILPIEVVEEKTNETVCLNEEKAPNDSSNDNKLLEDSKNELTNDTSGIEIDIESKRAEDASVTGRITEEKTILNDHQKINEEEISTKTEEIPEMEKSLELKTTQSICEDNSNILGDLIDNQKEKESRKNVELINETVADVTETIFADEKLFDNKEMGEKNVSLADPKSLIETETISISESSPDQEKVEVLVMEETEVSKKKDCELAKEKVDNSNVTKIEEPSKEQFILEIKETETEIIDQIDGGIADELKILSQVIENDKTQHSIQEKEGAYENSVMVGDVEGKINSDEDKNMKLEEKTAIEKEKLFLSESVQDKGEIVSLTARAVMIGETQDETKSIVEIEKVLIQTEETELMKQNVIVENEEKDDMKTSTSEESCDVPENIKVEELRGNKKEAMDAKKSFETKSIKEEEKISLDTEEKKTLKDNTAIVEEILDKCETTKDIPEIDIKTEKSSTITEYEEKTETNKVIEQEVNVLEHPENAQQLTTQKEPTNENSSAKDQILLSSKEVDEKPFGNKEKLKSEEKKATEKQIAVHGEVAFNMSENALEIRKALISENGEEALLSHQIQNIIILKTQDDEKKPADIKTEDVCDIEDKSDKSDKSNQSSKPKSDKTVYAPQTDKTPDVKKDETSKEKKEIDTETNENKTEINEKLRTERIIVGVEELSENLSEKEVEKGKAVINEGVEESSFLSVVQKPNEKINVIEGNIGNIEKEIHTIAEDKLVEATIDEKKSNQEIVNEVQEIENDLISIEKTPERTSNNEDSCKNIQEQLQELVYDKTTDVPGNVAEDGKKVKIEEDYKPSNVMANESISSMNEHVETKPDLELKDEEILDFTNIQQDIEKLLDEDEEKLEELEVNHKKISTKEDCVEVIKEKLILNEGTQKQLTFDETRTEELEIQFNEKTLGTMSIANSTTNEQCVVNIQKMESFLPTEKQLGKLSKEQEKESTYIEELPKNLDEKEINLHIENKSEITDTIASSQKQEDIVQTKKDERVTEKEMKENELHTEEISSKTERINQTEVPNTDNSYIEENIECFQMNNQKEKMETIEKQKTEETKNIIKETTQEENKENTIEKTNEDRKSKDKKNIEKTENEESQNDQKIKIKSKKKKVPNESKKEPVTPDEPKKNEFKQEEKDTNMKDGQVKETNKNGGNQKETEMSIHENIIVEKIQDNSLSSEEVTENILCKKGDEKVLEIKIEEKELKLSSDSTVKKKSDSNNLKQENEEIQKPETDNKEVIETNNSSGVKKDSATDSNNENILTNSNIEKLNENKEISDMNTENNKIEKKSEVIESTEIKSQDDNKRIIGEIKQEEEKKTDYEIKKQETEEKQQQVESSVERVQDQLGNDDKTTEVKDDERQENSEISLKATEDKCNKTDTKPKEENEKKRDKLRNKMQGENEEEKNKEEKNGEMRKSVKKVKKTRKSSNEKIKVLESDKNATVETEKKNEERQNQTKITNVNEKTIEKDTKQENTVKELKTDQQIDKTLDLNETQTQQELVETGKKDRESQKQTKNTNGNETTIVQDTKQEKTVQEFKTEKRIEKKIEPNETQTQQQAIVETEKKVEERQKQTKNANGKEITQELDTKQENTVKELKTDQQADKKIKLNETQTQQQELVETEKKDQETDKQTKNTNGNEITIEQDTKQENIVKELITDQQIDKKIELNGTQTQQQVLVETEKKDQEREKQTRNTNGNVKTLEQDNKQENIVKELKTDQQIDKKIELNGNQTQLQAMVETEKKDQEIEKQTKNTNGNKKTIEQDTKQENTVKELKTDQQTDEKLELNENQKQQQIEKDAVKEITSKIIETKNIKTEEKEVKEKEKQKLTKNKKSSQKLKVDEKLEDEHLKGTKIVKNDINSKEINIKYNKDEENDKLKDHPALMYTANAQHEEYLKTKKGIENKNLEQVKAEKKAREVAAPKQEKEHKRKVNETKYESKATINRNEKKNSTTFENVIVAEKSYYTKKPKKTSYDIDRSDMSLSKFDSKSVEGKELRNSPISRSKYALDRPSLSSRTYTCQYSNRSPLFITFLMNRQAIVSSSVRLTCSISTSEKITIKWYKNGNPIKENANFNSYFINGLAELCIRKVSVTDSGEYKCEASNGHGVSSTKAYLTVTDNKKDESNYQTDSKLKYWREHYRDNRSTSRKLMISHESSKSTIATFYPKSSLSDKLEKYSSGMMKWKPNEYFPLHHKEYLNSYLCSSKHFAIAKLISSDFDYIRPFLSIYKISRPLPFLRYGKGRPPIFLSRPDRAINVQLGEDVSVSFRLDGDPKPKIFLLRGLSDITENCRSFRESVNDYTRITLKVLHTEDLGTYCILAKNIHGCDRAFFTLMPKKLESSYDRSTKYITEPLLVHSSHESTIICTTPRFNGILSSRIQENRRPLSLSFHKKRRALAPNFYTLPRSKVIDEGETVRFQCAVIGYPEPYTVWEKDNIIITPNYKVRISEMNHLRFLEIIDVKKRDAGVYTIFLENEAGKIETSVRLDVMSRTNHHVKSRIRARSLSPSIFDRRNYSSSNIICKTNMYGTQSSYQHKSYGFMHKYIASEM